MKIVLTITDETKDAGVSVTVEGEETRSTRAQRVFDLILPALALEFQPVKTYLRTRSRRAIQEPRS